MKLLLSVFVLGWAACVNAESWYVDNEATGSNSGISWSDAWVEFSSVRWGTGGVKAGDTLFISGGSSSKTYAADNSCWRVGAEGTSDAPITIRVGQDEGHNGIVIFDYDEYGDFASVIGVNASEPWIKFDGEVDGVSHWRFANLRNILNRSTAYAIYGGNASGFEARFLTFTNCNQGIRIQNHGSDGVRIYRNDFLQIRGNGAISVLDGGSSSVSNLVYSNRIELVYNDNEPPGGVGAYSGPDGIHVCSWSKIHHNTFRIDRNTDIYTSPQHPDYLQTSGSHISIFCNEFVNIGDSAIDVGIQASPGTSDIMIYNNVFRIEEEIDPYPEYIRMYAKSSVPAYPVERFYVFNNTFIDNSYSTTYYAEWWNSNFTGSFKFINNLFYNCGGGNYRATFRMEGWPNYTPGDVVLENNIYYHDILGNACINFGEVVYTASTWVSTTGIETGGKTDQPIFVSYVPNGANNDLRLSSADTAARGAGVDLSAYFTTDKDGNPRIGQWDIGAYQYRSGVKPPPLIGMNP